MKNIITNGPLDPVVPKDAPNPSSLDTITDAENAKSINGHEVVLRVPLSEVRTGNED